MNKLLSIIQDSSGQMSSTRIGKIVIIGCFAFNWIAHILNPVEVPEPSMTMMAAVLGVLGISVGQKAVEGKEKKTK